MSAFSPRSFLISSLFAGALACILLAGSGCADLISYSNKYHQDGVAYLQQGDYTHAIGAFQSAVRADPRDYDSQYDLGVSYDDLGEHESAWTAYKNALALEPDPNSPDTRAYHAKIIDALANSIALYDNHDVELDATESRVATNPTYDGFYLLAKIYRYRNDPDLAIKEYALAASDDPNNFQLAKERALYLLSLSQTAQAQPALITAYRLNQDDPDVNAALQSLNIVPGPSLLTSDELAKPILPRGPLPELHIGFGPNQPAPAPAATPSNLSNGPKD